MTSTARALYGAWLERNAYTTVLIYCGLIVFFLPAFHWVLLMAPGVTSDYMPLRMISVVCSAIIGTVLLAFPSSRRYVAQLQFINVITVLLVVVALVVLSRDNYLYIAAGLLVLVGAQQAFLRPSDLILSFTAGFAFQLGLTWALGFLTEPASVIAISIYGAGYIIAFLPAYFRMKAEQDELTSRIEAIQVRSELEQVHALTHLGNWHVDLLTGETEWSAEMMRIYRMPLDTTGEKLRGVYESSIHPDDRAAVQTAFDQSTRLGVPFSVEHRLFTADYSLRWVHVQGQHQYDEHGTAVRRTCAVLDISERKEAEERLVQMATYDQLTSLPNRATLQSLLADALKADRPECSVFFLDLDRFKDINDSLGHATGDLLLRAVAERLKMMLPEHAVLARWGGDEFVMIVRDTDRERLEHVAHNLIRSIAEPFAIEQYELVITGSIGVARAPHDGTDPGVLIRNADTAMYHAKESVQQSFAFFESAMHQAASARHHVQNELHKAIWNNRLLLHYQPIIDVRTGKVIAAEALLRWVGQDGLIRHPEHFIPIAEDTGEIVPIGTWALQDACRQIKAWQSAGERLSVAVNISARQLHHPEFLDTLSLILRQTQIDPSLLDIEVTETALLSSTQAIFETLAMIRSLGPRISIDDFGTGYSTFSYLKRFQVDALKLDGSFVNGIDRLADRAIAESIVKVAHALGLRVIAEGVEHRSQLDILEEMLCDEAQGYLISRPVPAPEFEAAAFALR